jgi:hypothetical protein
VIHIFKYGGARGEGDRPASDRNGHHHQRRRFGDSKALSEVALCGLTDSDPLNPLPAILIDHLNHLDQSKPGQQLCPACLAVAKTMGFEPTRK